MYGVNPKYQYFLKKKSWRTKSKVSDDQEDDTCDHTRFRMRLLFTCTIESTAKEMVFCFVVYNITDGSSTPLS